MMRRKLLFTGLTGVIIITLLSAASMAFDRAQQRKVLYDYLDEALLAPRPVEDSVAWAGPADDLARAFTSVDAHNLGKAISRALSALAVSQDTGETAVLPDYFTGVALHRAELAATQSHDAGTGAVALHSIAQPVFYHLDGSVFQARLQSIGVRFAKGPDGLGLFHASRDTTITTLMNESTGWRVFSHERVGVEPLAQARRPSSDLRLAGINYYPADTPWSAFWREFDARTVAEDFDRIAALGGNAVRIFLPREPFLTRPATPNIDKLSTLLDLAARRGLRVVPTLFDLKGGYGLAGWTDDAAYLQALLPVLAAHRAVAYLDIKNEPDLDFAAHGRAQVEAWLRSMIVLCREMAPNLPLTIGWSASDHVAIVADALDLITYHDYQPVEGTAARLTDVRVIAGDKPVMITEIGASTWSVLAGWPGSPGKQARQLSARLRALDGADGVFIWTLHDFPNPEAAAVGHKPWVRRTQGAFGLIDSTGAAKPAATVVADRFTRFTRGTSND